jgi:hypothetical protein
MGAYAKAAAAVSADSARTTSAAMGMRSQADRWRKKFCSATAPAAERMGYAGMR